MKSKDYSFILLLSMIFTSCIQPQGTTIIINVDQDQDQEMVTIKDMQVVDPDMQVVNPDMQVVNPDMQVVNPDMQVVNPDMQVVDPDMQVINPDMQVVDPDMQVISPDMQVINPDMQVINPDMQICVSGGCGCEEGYILDQGQCVDFDECVTGQYSCDPNFDCINLSGAYDCVPSTCGNGSLDTGEECEDGNRVNLDGCNHFCRKESCYDIDEPNYFDQPAQLLPSVDYYLRNACLNDNDSYYIDVFAGSSLDIDITGLIGTGILEISAMAIDDLNRSVMLQILLIAPNSFRISYMAMNHQKIKFDIKVTQNSQNLNNPYEIRVNYICNSGYNVGIDGRCIDINECAMNICSATEDCVNIDGSYRCQCKAGYELDSTGQCVDIDECNREIARCQTGEICINQVGTYQCTQCGNSIVNTNESCDDGNHIDFDGCSASCQREDCYDQFEPNNVLGEAVKLFPSLITYEANACINNDDWYFVDVPPGSTAQILIQAQNNTIPLSVEAFDGNNVNIFNGNMGINNTLQFSRQSVSSLNSERISFRVLAQTIVVNQINIRNLNNPYTINVTISPLDTISLCGFATTNQTLYNEQECFILPDISNTNVCDYANCMYNSNIFMSNMCIAMNSNISFDYSDTYSSTQDLCVSSIMNANNNEDNYTFKICDQSDLTVEFQAIDTQGINTTANASVSLELWDKQNTAIEPLISASNRNNSGQITLNYRVLQSALISRSIQLKVNIDPSSVNLDIVAIMKLRYKLKITQTNCIIRLNDINNNRQ